MFGRRICPGNGMLSFQYSPPCPRCNIADSTVGVVSLSHAITVTRQHNDKAIDYQHAVSLLLPRVSDSEVDRHRRMCRPGQQR